MVSSHTHRPWPLPRRPWVMHMQWRDLLFMHWPVPAAALRDRIPDALEIDTFGGTAWIGVVPFSMAGVRPRFVPALPKLSAFAELNVRTYVTLGGKPGVWFFSLDAANPLAVEGARLAFHLPYYNARMSARRTGSAIRYDSARTHRGAPPAALRAEYQPAGPVYEAAPGSIDSWLTARYCLYSANRRGRIWRGEIDHAPWPLQPAAADIAVNTMTASLGLALGRAKPLLHFAQLLDVVAWPVELVV